MDRLDAVEGDDVEESRYNRKLLLAACQLLKSVGHSDFDALILELLPLDTSVGQNGNLTDKANSLARYAAQDETQLTPDGANLWNEIVDRAIAEHSRYPPQMNINNVSRREREAFQNLLDIGGLSAPKKSSLFDDDDPPKSFVSKLRASTATSIAVTAIQQNESVPMTNEKPHRVFIVHGRDEAPKEKVARFIERLGFEAVILHEQVNGGRTIIEKFIVNSQVHFAVVLLTPDDAGGLVGVDAQEPRARQNVIIEWGFFLGALGREKVMALMKGDVIVPSDALGMVWEALDQHGAWKQKLAKEMENAGFSIDWKKASS
jgi:predicted nucleotide-binding protein